MFNLRSKFCILAPISKFIFVFSSYYSLQHNLLLKTSIFLGVIKIFPYYFDYLASFYFINALDLEGEADGS
jgi:hypothetical protein